MRTPRARLQLPQSTHRKPQEPRRTFFSAQNGLKMAKNDQKTVKIRIILRYFALFLARKKCAEGAHAPCPLETTSIHPQKASGTPAHFFSAENGLKMAKNDQKPSEYAFFWRYFALFLAQKKCAEGAHAPYTLATTSNHPQKASGTPAHFFSGRKRPQNGQNDPQQM